MGSLLLALLLLALGSGCAQDAVAGRGPLPSSRNVSGCSGAGLLPFHQRLCMQRAPSRPLEPLCPTWAHDKALTSPGTQQSPTAMASSAQPHAAGNRSTASAPALPHAGGLAAQRHSTSAGGKQHSQHVSIVSTSAGGKQQAGSSIAAEQVTQAAGGSTPGFVGVYVGWLAQGNMGDEIVADLFLDLFVAALIQATDPSTCVDVERSSQQLASTGWRGCNMSAGRGCDFAVLGGGSTVSVDYTKRIETIMRARRPVLLFGSGYQNGAWPHPPLRIAKFYGLLCRSWLSGGVRGPYTKAQLLKHGCSQNLSIIRDSGFLADPLYYQHQQQVNSTATTAAVATSLAHSSIGSSSAGSHQRLIQQLQQHVQAGRLVLAVTLKQEFLPLLSRTILHLLTTKRFAVVLQAVDNATLALHRDYQAQLNNILPSGAPPVLVSEEIRNWTALLEVYHNVNVSLNSRLHSGVLSSSALRPTVYVATNTKFIDFGASLGTERREPGVGVTAGLGSQPEQDLVRSVLHAVNQLSVARQRLAAMQRDTLLNYHTAMTDFVKQLRQRDPQRFQDMMCCEHLRVVRSTPYDKRQLIMVQCLRPREQPR